MRKPIKIILITITSLILLLAICAGGYVAYMQAKYYRIEDNLSLETTNNQNSILKTNTDYSALTYNIGFGAYDQDYSFFMDTGTMKDGTPVTGKSSRGNSKESVLKNTNGSTNLIKELSPDFALLQEVDVKATRSYGINQKENIEKAQEAIKDIDVEVNDSLDQEWVASTLDDVFNQQGRELSREESLKLADKYLEYDRNWEGFDQTMCEWVAKYIENNK